KRIARKMATPRLADLRNIYSVKDAKRAGFYALSSGAGSFTKPARPTLS
ncbi:MAG: UDP-glucose 6-dehydrogenase, partial [Roseovarius gahaiensis]